jgi:hypothetical protein
MIISLFMEQTPLSGRRDADAGAGADDQQQDRKGRGLRTHQRLEQTNHVSGTARKLNW